eukprot:353689-Chlamydomonas_euryale.AAC.4
MHARIGIPSGSFKCHVGSGERAAPQMHSRSPLASAVLRLKSLPCTSSRACGSSDGHSTDTGSAPYSQTSLRGCNFAIAPARSARLRAGCASRPAASSARRVNAFAPAVSGRRAPTPPIPGSAGCYGEETLAPSHSQAPGLRRSRSRDHARALSAQSARCQARARCRGSITTGAAAAALPRWEADEGGARQRRSEMLTM